MSDFSVYTAEQIADWMSQGTVNTPPSSIYVALFDATDTEVSTDFTNDRPETTASTDWTIVNSGFENATEIDFGEAGVDVTDIQDVALFDAATGGNEIARFELADALFDVSDGTRLIFNTQALSFDVIDRTE